MAIEEINKIKEIFSKLGLHPVYLEHEPVITSEDAARTRGFQLKQGIKALIFTNGKDYVVVDVPADQRVDTKKVALKVGWSRNNLRMATEEEVMEKSGCEIGAVPPFGHKTNIPIIYDSTIFDNEVSTFNIGLRTNSVKIPTSEMKIVFNEVGAEEGDFIKL